MNSQNNENGNQIRLKQVPLDQPFCDPTQQDPYLVDTYVRAMDCAASQDLSLDISLEDFSLDYDCGDYGSVENYVAIHGKIILEDKAIEPSEESPIEPLGELFSEYYYNTGLTLPAQATYGRYLLLPNINKGDIIHEDAGAFGLTGHSVIVEGKFFCTTRRIFFVRLIEAIGAGVVRSILDDRRIDDRIGMVLRVDGVTTTQLHNVVEFNRGQLGKPYSMNFARRNHSPSSPNWYCSELVWASFFQQANISVDGRTSGTVFPRNIRDHSSTRTIGITGTFPGRRFTDIVNQPIAVQNAVVYLANNGVVAGTSATTFSPNSVLTRAAMVTLLYKMVGEPRVTGNMPFRDVPVAIWYRDAVLWAFNQGIVSGTSSTTFSPDGAVTREQLATFLHNFVERQTGFRRNVNVNILNSFTDRTQVSSWALTAVRWAFTQNALQDISGLIRPTQNATRAQVALAVHTIIRQA